MKQQQITHIELCFLILFAFVFSFWFERRMGYWVSIHVCDKLSVVLHYRNRFGCS